MINRRIIGERQVGHLEPSMLAAVIIAAIVCVFSYFLVGLLATSVIRKMKEEVFEYIRVYNQYLTQEEEQGSQSASMEIMTASTKKDKENAKSESALLSIPFIPSAKPMQKNDFSKDYLKIREAFSFDMKSILNRVCDLAAQEKKDEKGEAYASILDKLSFESVYKLSCIQAGEQLRILREILNEAENRILEEYITYYEGSFEVISFVSYVTMREMEGDKTIFLFTNDIQQTDNLKQLEGVKILHDRMLCEGFQILIGNRFYDYGIRSTELIR